MNERASALLLGARVADAASLGLHWIYDPERIARVAGDAPEFVEPDLGHYRGTTAYFAHAGKRAGDPTHYGEQLAVLERSLEATSGELDERDYERRFVEAFGPGGTWVGYIDFATRETLRNLDAAERTALGAARAVDLGEHEEDRSLMEAKVMANVQRWRGAKLAEAMAKAVRITHGEHEALIAAGQAMARAVEAARTGSFGADDAQLPAVSKLPALASHCAGRDDFDALVERAVRVTNDSDEAVAWARPVGRLLAAAVLGASPREAVAAAGELPSGAAPGPACPLPQAVPVILDFLADAADYPGTVRRNILHGGDSAGRAVVVGAVLGAAYGVPDDWRARYRG